VGPWQSVAEKTGYKVIGLEGYRVIEGLFHRLGFAAAHSPFPWGLIRTKDSISPNVPEPRNDGVIKGSASSLQEKPINKLTTLTN
jgi:hypothetical protein